MRVAGRVLHPPDSTIPLLRDPYGFISARCDSLGVDAFRTRIRLEPTICMRGGAAAEVFSDPERFIRAGASPTRVRATLTGEGGVQGLDGEAHRRRKALHLALASDAATADLVAISAALWESRIGEWVARGGEVVLYDELAEMTCEAACRWAGIPLAEGQLGQLTADLLAMVEGPGSLGPGYRRARRARRRCEDWLAGLVEQVRSGTVAAPPDRALRMVAEHRESDGSPLAARTAAVELISALRPTDAIARYVVFCAIALHEHPGWRERLRAGEPADALRFAQEVRRLSPFFPFIAARVRGSFDWAGLTFPAGRLVLVDLPGTNRDPRVWGPDAGDFRPERFGARGPGPFAVVAHGAGDAAGGHRCSGEALTLELALLALRALGGLDYTVPAQDLTMRRSRAPALPESRLVIADVTRRR